MRWVLDTNVALYLMGGRLAESPPVGEQFVSVITELEMLSWPKIDPAGEAAVRALLADVQIIELTAGVKEAAIAIRRQSRLKLADSVVAGTAIALSATLLTCDEQMLRVLGSRARSLRVKA